MPRVTIEFYKPVVENEDQISFADSLDLIAQMNTAQRIRGAPDPAGIFSLQRNGGEFVGDAARIRMEDLPRVADVATGQLHDLNVGAREGLSEEIHFLYDATIDVIAVQKKLLMRASALRDLISDLTGNLIQFQIILRRDAWERFQRMPLVKKVSFKLARPQDVAGHRRPSLRRMFQEIAEFNGVSAKIEVSVERERDRSLNLESVREVVTSYREREGDFEALSITGAIRDEEGETPETIDFIKERLQYVEEVPRRGRRLDPDGCRLALRRGIRAHREYLRRYRE
jgi:uncharacterized protein DUF6731